MLPRNAPHLFSFLFIFLFLLFVSTLILHFVQLDPIKNDDSDEIFSSAPYDVHIFSAFYYNRSKSLGDSAIAIVMTADFEILNEIQHFELLGLNETDRIIQKAQLERVTPHDACKWITILATSQLLPNLKQLYLSLGTKHAPIPFDVVSTQPKPVVMCISPLFASENWQNLFLALHVYKRFGAHMHLYIRSVVSPMLEILRIYEKEHFLTIQSWARINLLNRDDDDFNPNLNVEFRNQAAAQTNCLLRFKESSEFVAFLDLDDLLIPRLGSNYLTEFQILTSLHPDVSYMRYSKENVRTDAYRRASHFSLEHMLRTVKFDKKTETGKIVVSPAKLNSTWIHWTEKKLKMTEISAKLNSITHLKNIRMIDGFGGNHDSVDVPIYDPSIELDHSADPLPPLISDRDIRAIEKDYNRMSWKSGVRRHLRHLPTHPKYASLIGSCFRRTFYKYHEILKESTMLCPGPERCDLTSHQAKCWNSVGEYHSTMDGNRINVHFVDNSDFKLDNNGCIV